MDPQRASRQQRVVAPPHAHTRSIMAAAPPRPWSLVLDPDPRP